MAGDEMIVPPVANSHSFALSGWRIASFASKPVTDLLPTDCPKPITLAVRNRQPAATLWFTFLWMRFWYQLYTLFCQPGIPSRTARSFSSALESGSLFLQTLEQFLGYLP